MSWRRQRRDLRVLDHDGNVVMPSFAVEDNVGGHRVSGEAAHRVRVILRRWRGRSAFLPRAAAKRTTMA